jgi:AraC-like DNA-binding protein
MSISFLKRAFLAGNDARPIMPSGVKDVLQKPAETYDPRGRLDPVGFEHHVSFATYPPPDDLAGFIKHFWTIHWANQDTVYRSEELMHQPYVDVFVSIEQSGIQGTFRGKRTYLAAGNGRIIGARFRPGAFHAFWNGSMADLQDQIIELKEAFPQADRRFIEDLLALDDQAVIDGLVNLIRSKNPQPDANLEIINQIIAAIETQENLLTVTAVAKAFGKSERWIQQLFRDYLGIGLKWLLQRHKLLLAAQQIREGEQPNWVAMAYDLGYSSQQHFISDFKQVLGQTPVQYKKGLSDL